MSDPDLAETLDAAVAFVRRFVTMSDEQADACVLFVGHAHAIEAAQDSPRLHVTSPEPESGKSRLLEVLATMAPRPRVWVGPSEAVLFRTVESQQPTLFLDEIDTVFSEKAAKENDGVRQFLNTGYHRGATVPRCLVEGKSVNVVEFGTFAAVALAGIGDLPRTVATRSIPIRLDKRPPGTKVAKYHRARAAAEGNALRDELAEIFTEDVVDHLGQAEPEPAPGLSDRHDDVWDPLLAIAELAGGTWPARARRAAVALCGRDDRAAEPSRGVQLLADVWAIFVRRDVDRLGSGDLLEELVALEDAPWADHYFRRRHADERALDSRGLARLFKPYDVFPQNIRLPDGSVAKGYTRDRLEPAWRSYASTVPPHDPPFSPLQRYIPVGDSDPGDSPIRYVADEENPEIPLHDSDVALWRMKTPDVGGETIPDPSDDGYAERFRERHVPLFPEPKETES